MRLVVGILALCMAWQARAVIVSGGDGTGNATATGAGAGWNYVGSIGGASGVYLGDYGGSNWVLTAGHVGAGSFTLNGVTYAAVAESAVTLTNTDGSLSDLVLFRIDGSPGLTTLALSTSTPRGRTEVTMIGNGIGRAASETLLIEGSVYSGYYLNQPGAKRWGKNTVTGSTTIAYENSEVSTAGFYTSFSSFAGSAQAASGDSGGGVFTSNGTLAGIILAVGSLNGQPAGTAVYGDTTYLADVSAYRSQILEIVATAPVPEPSAVALITAAGVALAWRRRR